MASGVRSVDPHLLEPVNAAGRSLRLWPVFAVLPILVVVQVKAAGLLSVGGFDLTLLSVAFLLAVTLITYIRHPRYPVYQMLPFILFSLVVLLGVSMSNPGEYQVDKAREFLVTAVVVGCLPVLLRDVRDLRGLVAAWFIGGVLTSMLVLTVGGAETLWGRAGIGGATLGPAYMAAASLVAGGAALGERLLPAAVALPGIAVSGVALMTIGSRGPMVAAALGIGTWMLLRGVLRGRSLLILLIVGVAAIVGLRQASDYALSRLDFSDPAREELWATAWTAFMDSPLLGMGWGDYATLSVIAWSQKYPHNIFLEAASELGFLGLIGVLALLLIAGVRVWRSRSTPEVRVLAAVAGAMLAGQQFSTDLPNRVFWIALIPCLLLPVVLEAPASQPARPSEGRRGRSYRQFRQSADGGSFVLQPRDTRARRVGRQP